MVTPAGSAPLRLMANRMSSKSKRIFLSLFFVGLSLNGHRLPHQTEEFFLGQSNCFLIDANFSKEEKPWVWYAPTLPQHPDPCHVWYVDKLIEKGISFAGCDQGEVRGSPASIARFTDFYNEMGRRGFSRKPVLLGQSRGGLMMLSWAVRNPEKLSAFAGIYPVQNLRSWPMKRSLKQTLRDFGVDEKQFLQMVDRHNPVNHLQGMVAAKTPIFIVHGDSDEIVPFEENGGLVEHQYQKLGGKVRVELIPELGHEVDDLFFKSRNLLEFMIKRALFEG